MSVTRGNVRANEMYETPAWATRLLLERLPSLTAQGGLLEPAYGRGAIVSASNTPDGFWETLDAFVYEGDHVQPNRVCRFQDFNAYCRYWAVITNPPFSEAAEFVMKSRLVAHNVVMLLRMNWTVPKSRRAFRDCAIFPLEKRPFPDATDYAWHVWGDRGLITPGTWEVLR